MFQTGRTALLLLLFFAGFQVDGAFGLPAQIPFDMSLQTQYRPPKQRKLTGRFLHLTDMHPDPFFRVGASEKSACHRQKPKKAKQRADEFGFLYGECDAPLVLTNYTLDYLEKHWASEVDFVVWTGDSARHDNDRKLPRTLKEIYQLNRAMVSRMEDIFTSRGIPVIPSIGNNDVWPHNIMMPGPNDVTFEFSSIWKSFVPFHSYQVFQRGAYYSVEVIPDALAVVSLNTMYFFDSNKAVGGCDPKDGEDPGNLQFDWLDVQLAAFRDKGIQVWITGHVPPSARNYHPECHVRYLELSLRYQDTILGHLFGHMNADHFFLLDATSLHANVPSQYSNQSAEAYTDPFGSTPSNDHAAGDEDAVHISGKHKELYTTLLKDFGHISKTSEKKLDYDNLAVVNVAPSVVPNPYLPSFRIFSYNITGKPYAPGHLGDEARLALGSGSAPAELDLDLDSGMREQLHHSSSLKSMRRLGDSVDSSESLCSSGPDARNASWLCKLDDPWYSSPHSPSRTNRLWTPLGYAQYYLPRLNGTAKRPPKWKLEYLTFRPSMLHPPGTDGETSETGTGTPYSVADASCVSGGDGEDDYDDDDDDYAAALDGCAAKEDSSFVYPIPLKKLPKSLRRTNVTKSKFAPYGMDDLTIPSWLHLVRRLGRAKNEKLRKQFRRYMYMGAGEEL